MEKLLITGGTGFIGSNLIGHLIKKGNYKIYALSRLEFTDNASQNVKYIQHDLREGLQYEKLPQDIDYIVHLAAVMDKAVGNSRMFQINTTATLDLLEYGRSIGIKKFVYASTGGVYGYSKSPLSEESQTNPIDFYCLTKYQSEILVKHYSQYFSVAILRYFFPYGSKQIRGIFPTLFDRIRKGKPVILNNGGNPHINPIHISDAVELTSRIIMLEDRYVIINIAGAEIVNIRQLADLIGKLLQIRPVYENVVDNTILDLIGDTIKMQKLLGYLPIVSLKAGIEGLVQA